MSTTEQAPAAMTTDAATNGAQIEVTCPADGRVVGHIPIQGPEEIAAMAAQLRSAQPEWEAMGPEGRAKALYAWLDWIFDNEQRILEMVQNETGKSWGDTSIETMVAVEVINYYCKHAKEFLADQKFTPHGPAYLGKKLRVHAKPHQLVGIILPWNYPLGMPMMDVPGALLSGAAVLTKPSEVTPLAWTEVVRGFREEIGAPPIMASALGDGSTGAAVVDQVDMIQFTGSTRTGRKIGVRAMERLIPSSLELGGKDAMIVLDDANLDRAVGGAIWGGYFNAGQSCISVERIYVEEPVYDEFVSKLTQRVNELRQGMDAPGSLETDFGAMATEQQLEIVERHVNDAIEKGARAVTGGKRSDQGLFFEPTVLVDVDHTMACMREETFGPTLPVMKVKDEDEAVEMANDSPYGLAGSVWTKDSERAERIARRLETGGVSANNAMMTVFQFPMPMGGWKESGLGVRFGGPNGILKFCRQQAYSDERIDLKTEMHWYPYTKRKSGISSKMIRLLGAHDWRRRLGRKGR
jgi:acyl-CoA reductase-like NAD-dependent aldehyde dehydrogenase